MGSGCEPDNLMAIIEAQLKTNGELFDTDATMTKGYKEDQLFHFEKTIAKHLTELDGKDPFDTGASTNPARLRTAMNPSELLGDTFYQKIAGPIRAFEKAHGADTKKLTKAEQKAAGMARGKAYQKDIVEPMAKLLQEMKAIGKAHKGAELDRVVQEKYGFGADKFYDAFQYVTWVAEGGHTVPASKWNIVRPISRAYSGAMARMNPTWTIANMADVSRIIGAYVTKPAVLGKGLADTLFGEGGPIVGGFRQKKSLKAQGLYEASGGHERENFGNMDPFSWSVTLQKNLAFALDKADGGDGHTGVARNAFDPEPWDRPMLYRNADVNEIFGLARFPIAESIWHVNTTKRAFQGDAQAQANLVTYMIGKSIVFGAGSLVPAFIYGQLPDENEAVPIWSKKGWDEINEHVPFFNVAGKTIDAAGAAIGTKIDTDFVKFAQPFGGSLGARWQGIGRTAQEVPALAAKSVGNLSQGELGPAALNAFAAAIAVANLGIIPANIGPVANPLNNPVVNTMVNNTTARKLVKTWAKNLEEQYGGDRAWRDTFKALFGATNVKKDAAASSGAGHGRRRSHSR